jgi:tripartite-type tricarboxylate transporter receptor subunit TctC
LHVANFSIYLRAAPQCLLRRARKHIQHGPYSSSPALPASIERIRAGEIRPLAVTTPSRSEVLPEVPTVGEFVPGYESSSWYGVGAPKSTPTAIIDTLNKEVNVALSDRKIKARFAELGGTVLPGTPAEFGQVIADETEKWARVVKFAGVSPE